VIVAGVLLAGGLARRMGGGDKGMRELAGRPLLAWAIDRARPQVVALALNANGDPARFANWGLPIVPDSVADYPGPLAGVLAGLDWAASDVPGATHVASFATDAPFFPRDLVQRLAAAVQQGADLACAASAGQSHPVFGLWSLALCHDLRRALEQGVRKVDVWTARYRLATVDFAAEPVDPFFNVNRAEDLADAERLTKFV
jgi:molybdopterin-guanine dinucleotide biosynthesis protein A